MHNYQEYEKLMGKSKTLLEVFSEHNPELLAAVADIDIGIPLRSKNQRSEIEFD